MKSSNKIFILFLSAICISEVCFADMLGLQLRAQLKEIKVKNLKVSMPTLSPDNKKIAFASFETSKKPTLETPLPKPSKGNLYIINIEMNETTKISGSVILDDEPFLSWSPDSNSLIFGSKGEIWIVDIKSKKSFPIQKPNKKRIKTYTGYYKNYFHSPAWSPNGETIALRNVNDIWLYTRLSKSYEKIYTPPEGLKGTTNIWSLPLIVWSNDAKKLAFDQLKLVLPPEKNRKRLVEGISILEINKKEVKTVVGVNENMEYFPIFSPNNNCIAFFSRKDWDSKATIFINDLRINKSVNVAECEDECHMLSWSEDGSKIYFATNKALWVVNMKETTNPVIEKKILIEGVSDLSDVFWLPKGNTLYFLKPVEAGEYLLGLLKL